MNNKEITQKNIFDLIEKITPYNNRYRDLIKGGGNGTEILNLMWDVGAIIQIFIDEFQIKPHNLYWRIYGKSEGLKNSYITRDFLSYCLRIKKYFSAQEDISKIFPYLQKYSLFREAFPLLENPKFKLSDSEEKEIIKILNSNANFQKIKKTIQRVKSDRIGIKNTRKQKLGEMKPITDSFVIIYNEIYEIIKNNDQSLLDRVEKNLSKDILNTMSQAVSALTQENLYVPNLQISQKLPEQWEIFLSNIKNLFESSIETRNRFRRIVSPRKLFDLADMLNALTIERGIINYRKRKNIK
jgi:hypothetical protein